MLSGNCNINIINIITSTDYPLVRLVRRCVRTLRLRFITSKLWELKVCKTASISFSDFNKVSNHVLSVFISPFKAVCSLSCWLWRKKNVHTVKGINPEIAIGSVADTANNFLYASLTLFKRKPFLLVNFIVGFDYSNCILNLPLNLFIISGQHKILLFFKSVLLNRHNSPQCYARKGYSHSQQNENRYSANLKFQATKKAVTLNISHRKPS